MVVSEQIDALRALGVDPLRKLVAPRLIALLTMLPLLTLISNAAGIGGGGTVATTLYGQPMETFIASVLRGIQAEDVAAGLAKPLVFALIIGTVSCRQGMKTSGGTVGVGGATTRSVVHSSILVIVADFFLAKALQVFFGVS